MKKIGVLITSLVLGASSVALAQPAAYRRPVYQQPYLGAWTTLSSNLHLQRGRGATTIDVSTRERFTKLKLEAAGRVAIDRLTIVFANGATQLVDVGQALRWGKQSTLIDLDGNRGRRIDKIIVHGQPMRPGMWRAAGGSLTVLAT